MNNSSSSGKESNLSIRAIPSTIIDGSDKRIPKRIIRAPKAGGAAAGGNTGATGRSNDSVYVACRNPIDRFCQLLLPTKLYQQSSEDISSVQQIPMKFSNISEYVRTWEPLLVQEIKDHIISSIGMVARESCPIGTVTLVQAPENSDSAGLAKLSFVPQEKDHTTARDRYNTK